MLDVDPAPGRNLVAGRWLVDVEFETNTNGTQCQSKSAVVCVPVFPKQPEGLGYRRAHASDTYRDQPPKQPTHMHGAQSKERVTTALNSSSGAWFGTVACLSCIAAHAAQQLTPGCDNHAFETGAVAKHRQRNNLSSRASICISANFVLSLALFSPQLCFLTLWALLPIHHAVDAGSRDWSSVVTSHHLVHQQQLVIYVVHANQRGGRTHQAHHRCLSGHVPGQDIGQSGHASGQVF